MKLVVSIAVKVKLNWCERDAYRWLKVVVKVIVD